MGLQGGVVCPGVGGQGAKNSLVGEYRGVGRGAEASDWTFSDLRDALQTCTDVPWIGLTCFCFKFIHLLR